MRGQDADAREGARRSDEAPGRRRAVAAGLVVAGVLVAGGDEAPRAQEPTRRRGRPRRSSGATWSTARSLSGTLGYADAGTLAAGVAGTLTALRDPGAVITRGHSLYEVDGEPAAFLLYGDLPAWRDFSPGMTDGEDIRQLERNLRALGHDPGTVDDDWDWETTAAVKRFQDARGLDEDGTLSRGEIVFRPGPGADRRGEGGGRRPGLARPPGG